jgi:hypothetical protein
LQVEKRGKDVTIEWLLALLAFWVVGFALVLIFFHGCDDGS